MDEQEIREDERRKLLMELQSEDALLYMVAGYHGVHPDRDSIREHLRQVYEDEDGYVLVGYPDERANMKHALGSTFIHLACDRHTGNALSYIPALEDVAEQWFVGHKLTYGDFEDYDDDDGDEDKPVPFKAFKSGRVWLEPPSGGRFGYDDLIWVLEPVLHLLAKGGDE